jgi:parallel beta-helix repeat protein
MLNVAFNILPATASPPVHNIDTGLDYATIQEAVNANETLDGHTILVDAGVYYENVVLNKTLSLVGENRTNTVIDGNGTGEVVSIKADNTTISEFTIQNGTRGITIKGERPPKTVRYYGNIITANVITRNTDGIILYASDNNNIAGNTITSNLEGGIRIGDFPTYQGWDTGSNNNTIVGNTISLSNTGILLLDSSHNTFSENRIFNNTGGIVTQAFQMQILSNSICSNIIADNSIGLSLWTAGNQIAGNALYSNELGMYISAGNDTVVNNTIDNNAFGMCLDSSNNLLRDNELLANHYNLIGPLWPGVQAPYNDIDISNAVNGKPIYYLVNQTDLDISPSSFPGVGYLALVDCFNVTVKGLTLTNNGQGILLSQCVNCTIEGNSLKNNLIAISAYTNGTAFSNNIMAENYHGIALMGYYNQILDNTIANNTLRLCPYRWPETWSYSNPIFEWITDWLMWYSGGIYLWADNNTIINNSIINNEQGILLHASSFNVLRNNSMVGNVYNFGIDWTRLFPYEWNIRPPEPPQISPFLMNDVDASNTVNGKPIYWWINRRNEQVPTDAGYVVLVNSTNMIIRDLVLQNNTQGLLLIDVNDSVISGNVITGTRYGIQIRPTLYTLVNNTIMHNNMTKNGIGVESAITNSTFYDNALVQNLAGICDLGEGHNLIVGNNVTKNAFPPKDEWILGYYPPHFMSIIGYHWGGVGIILESSNNTVCYNNVQENENGMSGYSLITLRGGNHKIYHNNFINNTEHFERAPRGYVVGGTCDSGYPGGGNYWSDYNGTDLFSGTYQNETGSDGTGDTPYVIDANNADRYPLAAPISVFDAGTWNGASCNVEIVSNSTVSNLQIGVAQEIVSFNVTGSASTYGFCKVTIPNIIAQELWHGNYTVLLNGEPWPLRNWTDSTNTYIYINYTHSQQQIVIVPEFPSLLILPLFFIATLLTVTVYRRKHPSAHACS